jgi:hypothetical protein
MHLVRGSRMLSACSSGPPGFCAGESCNHGAGGEMWLGSQGRGGTKPTRARNPSRFDPATLLLPPHTLLGVLLSPSSPAGEHSSPRHQVDRHRLVSTPSPSSDLLPPTSYASRCSAAIICRSVPRDFCR